MGWWNRRTNTPDQGTAYQPPASGVSGATIRVSSKADHYRQATWATEEMAQHREYCTLYEQTIAGAIINAETDDLFAQGWAVQGSDPDAVAKVREYLTAADFVQEVKKLAVESKIYGFGLAEVGKVGARHVLVAHTSYNIVPVMDPDGWLDGYRQLGTNDTVLAEWDRREVITLALRPSAATPGTGRSEIAQAYQALIDYENIRKANTEMIMRMGYPTYEVEFTNEDGIVPAEALEGQFADIDPGSVWASGLGSKLNTVNAQGVTQAAVYAETALQAVAVAMQVPRSMAGLADNSEATARVTTAKYYNKIASEQAIIAQVIQREYLDTYVLPDLGIPKGTIQIYFNNPDPDAQLKRAQLLQILTTLDPTDPEFLLDVEEMAELWGKHPRPGEYDESKLRDSIIEGVAAHIASITAPAGSEPSIPGEGARR